jgi:hypothetical protein
MEVRQSPVSARTASQTSAEDLAAATGATISRTEDGFAAVTFDAPSSPQIARAWNPATPSRTAPGGDSPSIGNRPPPAAPTTAAPPPKPTESSGPGNPQAESAPSTDKDEIYDYVVDRLKRDLFAEQEQAGLGPTLI